MGGLPRDCSTETRTDRAVGSTNTTHFDSLSCDASIPQVSAEATRGVFRERIRLGISVETARFFYPSQVCPRRLDRQAVPGTMLGTRKSPRFTIELQITLANYVELN